MAFNDNDRWDLWERMKSLGMTSIKYNSVPPDGELKKIIQGCHMNTPTFFAVLYGKNPEAQKEKGLFD